MADNEKDLHVAMSMFNITEYSDNYKKTLGSLWRSTKMILLLLLLLLFHNKLK